MVLSPGLDAPASAQEGHQLSFMGAPHLANLSDDYGEAANVGQLMALKTRVWTSPTMRYLRDLETRVR